MSQRIFVTGATGYLGHAVSTRLMRAGHTVFGLTRDGERARMLAGAGLHPVLGDLAEPESYLAQLKNCDVVVHLAFEPGSHSAQQDQRALEAMRAGALDGRVRRVLYTSGIWVHGDTGGRIVDETASLAATPLVGWRPAHEDVVHDLAAQDVAAVILRPGMVYGAARGTFAGWFKEAKERGSITYPGGEQHWTMVHVDDVAAAYVLALEHAPGGSRYLLVDDSRFTVRELAEAAAAATGARALPWSPQLVLDSLGTYGQALLLDSQATAARARRELGWTPLHTSFVNDAEALNREWLAGQDATVR